MRGDHAWSYVFVLGFLAIATAETFLPLRSLRSSTPRRWTSNLVLFLASTVAVTFAFQVSAVALAFAVRSASHGLLNRVHLPYGVQFAIGFALLDFTFYGSHRLFHAIALMWRVHQVHHAESDLDLTTGFRFHPLEAIISQGLLMTTIALLGPPAGAVALSAMATVLQDYLQHANLRFPEAADRLLRVLIVTPATHRVHHSEELARQNANFGTVFTLWDRLFGTYVAGDRLHSQEARCGLAELANGSELNAAQLLFLPFRRASKPLLRMGTTPH
jgi:sterol desaturase/sphingolipid hydroxylase (fatty acid hydroxylase superfamily)